MEDFSVHFNEPANYKERSSTSIKIISFVSLGLLAFWMFTNEKSNWQFVFLIAIVFCLIQFLKSAGWDKYFITVFEIKGGQVLIRYSEKGQQKVVTGLKPDFKALKKLTFNKTRTPYLAIYYKGDLLLTQYKVGAWTEDQFKRIVEALD